MCFFEKSRTGSPNMIFNPQSILKGGPKNFGNISSPIHPKRKPQFKKPSKTIPKRFSKRKSHGFFNKKSKQADRVSVPSVFSTGLRIVLQTSERKLRNIGKSKAPPLLTCSTLLRTGFLDISGGLQPKTG